MSAPTVERTRTAAEPARRTTPRRTSAPAAREAAHAGGAVGRAYARRARRLDGGDPGAEGRSRFVLLVMVLLGVGLVASLWLSTTAAADSYRLDEARSATQVLAERSETLKTEIAAMQAPPALARAAQQMGMVPADDVARLVRRPDGSVQVVGTPKAAVAPAPPPVPAAPPAAVADQGAPGQVGQGQAVDPGQAAAGQAASAPDASYQTQTQTQTSAPMQTPAPMQTQAPAQTSMQTTPDATGATGQ